MKRVIKNLLRHAGYEISPIRTPQSEKFRNPDIRDWEWKIYDRVKPFTMLSLERVLANIRAVDHIVRNQIHGDIVECGVWRGGSAMSMAMTLLRCGDTSRTLWMYDTYSGMTEPGEADLSYDRTTAKSLLDAAKKYEKPERSLVLAHATLEQVQENLKSTKYPVSQIRFVKGAVEQTIPNHIPNQIAFLRLDTDWYESTRHELLNLFPRVSRGGILIIDDYGHWQGAQKAVDEYFEKAPLFLHRIDYTGRLAVKQGN